MDLFKVSTTLEEAIKKGLIAIRDIAGRDSWKGMDIILENRTRFKGIDVHIPAGTVFRENSGQLQQMMMASPVDVHLPARQLITKPLDDVICTQPRVPAPPPRTIPINDGMRDAVSMSEQEFQDFLKEVVREGLVSEGVAEGLRRERNHIAKDPIAMAAIKSGKPEIRYDYSYSVLIPSSIPPDEMAEAYFGMAINLYEYDSKSRAVQMFRRAAQVASLGLDSFYGDVYRFASRFKDQEGAETILWINTFAN